MTHQRARQIAQPCRAARQCGKLIKALVVQNVIKFRSKLDGARVVDAVMSSGSPCSRCGKKWAVSASPVACPEHSVTHRAPVMTPKKRVHRVTLMRLPS
ncbi:hypothetical protein KCP71_12835 [Salmonella enterica subsp. enterica]|nr:hypothetical protein KCP71_12835 [Salmonella enterica subsp. enterica]